MSYNGRRSRQITCEPRTRFLDYSRTQKLDQRWSKRPGAKRGKECNAFQVNTCLNIISVTQVDISPVLTSVILCNILIWPCRRWLETQDRWNGEEEKRKKKKREVGAAKKSCVTDVLVIDSGRLLWPPKVEHLSVLWTFSKCPSKWYSKWPSAWLSTQTYDSFRRAQISVVLHWVHSGFAPRLIFLVWFDTFGVEKFCN